VNYKNLLLDLKVIVFGWTMYEIVLLRILCRCGAAAGLLKRMIVPIFKKQDYLCSSNS